MKGKAIVLHPDGREEFLLEKPSLELAQSTVGGYVQMLKLPVGRQMLVDEDGLLKYLPPNPKATELAAGAHMHPVAGIVGTVLILEGSYQWD